CISVGVWTDGPVGLVGRAALRACRSSPTHRVGLSVLHSPLYFDRLPHDPLQRPPLPAALRTRLDDLDDVAGLRFALLVVAHELRRAPLGLPVQPVPHLPLDGNDGALLHLA